MDALWGGGDPEDNNGEPSDTDDSIDIRRDIDDDNQEPAAYSRTVESALADNGVDQKEEIAPSGAALTYVIKREPIELGRIYYMSCDDNGTPKTIKAVCKLHPKCRCWINLRRDAIATEAHRDLIDWLSRPIDDEEHKMHAETLEDLYKAAKKKGGAAAS